MTTQPMTEPTQEIVPMQTAIATISVSNSLIETNNFQKVLAEIPVRVQEANALLADYRNNPDTFVDNIDEAALDIQLKQMEEVSSYVRDIDKSRKEIKSHLDKQRDAVLETLDKRLEGAQFDQLVKSQGDIKQLKKDVDTDRREKRWGEIRHTFEANVNRYPLIGEFAPELADFSRFKMLFPKLVTGAKTRKVKEADHTAVNETIYTWNTAIEIMKANDWGLANQELMQLLALFKQNPSVELVQREGRQLKLNADAREKARVEAEARRVEADKQAKIAAEKRAAEMVLIQERAAAAKLAQDAEAQKRAEQERLALEERARISQEQERKRQAEYAQFGGQYQTIFKESFPRFIEYLFQNPNYRDVHASAKTKAAVVYDIMRQVENPQSVVSFETGKDPQKILDLVRYILDA